MRAAASASARFEAVEVGRQEPRVEAVLDVPRPRAALERPDEQAGSLLAHVERPVRVAEHRQLPLARRRAPAIASVTT